MRSPELLGAAALATLLLLVLLPTHLCTRNVAILVIMFCLIATGISYIVNTLLWAGNVRDIAPVWCDISTNIWFVSQYGVECALLCICKRLDCITGQSGNSSREDRNRFEVVVCCFLPLFSIPLRYSLSTNRYMILENLGCLPAPYPSKLTMGLIFSPLLVLSLSILIFAGKTALIIVRLWYSLPTTNPMLTRARLRRLLAFCVVVGISAPTLISLLFSYSLPLAILPWPGWVTVHAHFSKPLVFPPSIDFPMLQKTRAFILCAFWAYAATAYLAIAILASGEDVQNDHRCVWAFLSRRLSLPPHPNVLTPERPNPLTETTAQQGSIMITGNE